MGFSNFFRELNFLEGIFMGSKIEGSEDGTVNKYSTEAKSTFFALRNYVLSCAWTSSDSVRYIVKNMRLNSAELAQKYEADTGKPKSEITFRVQRAAASKILYTIFGTIVSDTLISDRTEEILKLRNYVLMLTDGNKDINSLFSGYMLNKLLGLPEVGESYSVDDCSKELLVLSKFTTEYFEEQLGTLDLNKVKYIYNVLASNILIDSETKSFNRDKANMLSAIKKYARVQSSNKVTERDVIPEKVSELLARIDELEKDNLQKDALIIKMKDRFKADVDKRVEQILQEKSLKQKEEDNLKLFDDIDGSGKQQL